MFDCTLKPEKPRPKIALTIAGFDPSNGAGVTADLQIFAAHGIFGISAITALTVQSTLGVKSVHPADPDILRETLRHLTADIKPDGIKIGMLGSHEVVSVVAEFLRERADETKREIPIVFDPVLRSSSGASLLAENALSTVHQDLFPEVSWITPNWMELAVLSRKEVEGLDSAVDAAKALSAAQPHLNIVATGGDMEGNPTDFWLPPSGTLEKLVGGRVETKSTHGTGCAFSSALLCRLVQEQTALESVERAKEFVEQALSAAPPVGHGRGPMDLLWPLRKAETKAC